MGTSDLICLAGKNQVACDVLRGLLSAGRSPRDLRVIGNKDDTGRHTWQPSLLAWARRLDVPVITLAEAQELGDCTFLSVEFDRILRPERFRTRRIYNIHFSLLPRHRGVHTAIWPILEGDADSGVTLHQIDAGIDTGDVVDQMRIGLTETTTSRDLYFSLMDAGAALVLRHVDALMEGRIEVTPQNPAAATYHSRQDIDFASPPIRLDGTGHEASAGLRAFIFYEYQLPLHNGRRVFSVGNLSPEPLCESGGHWCRAVAYRDGHLELRYSPYADLAEWAAGRAGFPTNLGWRDVPDLMLRDKNGWCLLDIAAFACNRKALTALIDAGAPANTANLRGTTPLMYARSGAQRTGDDGCVRLLLERGANRAAKDWFGKTAAQYALEEGYPALHKILS